MITSIVSIGNSKGIRIPKILLKESGFERDVELKVKKGEIRITPVIKRKAVNIELLLSEKVLAEDWNRPEEDEAWKDLK
ncbi:MAG: AbrB/MazE/SpoVT family DNA-binding domain-containing protein [Patescibacteria group bacterium]